MNDKAVAREGTLDIFEDVPTLQRTAEEVFTLNHFRERVRSHKSLRIKYGVDVTAPFLHLGHAVNLWAMREMQEAGHKVVFLIGNFTTLIGDPTDKAKTRPKISAEEIEQDAEDYIRQVGLILRTDPDVFEVRRNSEWWGSMPLDRFMELLSLTTHGRLIQRDMFQKRLNDGSEIHMHEMLYPILQGYDSVALESDLTIVGTDQLFNELMGRFYQERLGHEPQIVVTTTITPGTDGRAKQSKSLGNYIALSDTPRDKFGKAMRLRDDLVTEFLRVYTLVPQEEIKQMEKAIEKGEMNPMDAKRKLGWALVERYHGEDTASREEEWFTKVFSQRSLPNDIPTITVTDPSATLLDILRVCVPSESRSALRRLIGQGGVRLNGDKKLNDPEQRDAVPNDSVLRVGKRRWFRISFPGSAN